MAMTHARQTMEVIYVMWLRQLKRYWRSRARMIGSLGQPILFLVAFGFGFGSIYAKAGGGNYIDFLAPGIICMSVLFTAMFGGIELIWDRQFGFLKETLVAPISRLTIMIGRTLGGATVAALQGVVIFLITLCIGFRPTNWWLLPLALVGLLLIALIFTALGTAIASKLDDMQAFPIVMNFLIMPTFFLSGALFPLDTSPKVLQWIADINPLAYGVDLVRGSLTSVWHYGFGLSFIVLIAVTAASIALGSWLFTKIKL